MPPTFSDGLACAGSVGASTRWPRASREARTPSQHQPPCQEPCTRRYVSCISSCCAGSLRVAIPRAGPPLATARTSTPSCGESSAVLREHHRCCMAGAVGTDPQRTGLGPRPSLLDDDDAALFPKLTDEQL